MEDLFKQYWWLLFPLAWFIGSGWQSWLNYRRHKDTLEIVRDYTRSGKEPPAALLDKLNAPPVDNDWDGSSDKRSRREHGRTGFGGWSQVVLFGSLGAGFLYASITDLYEAGPAFLIVTFVMGALCLASLVATLTTRTPKD